MTFLYYDNHKILGFKCQLNWNFYNSDTYIKDSKVNIHNYRGDMQSSLLSHLSKNRISNFNYIPFKNNIIQIKEGVPKFDDSNENNHSNICKVVVQSISI